MPKITRHAGASYPPVEYYDIPTEEVKEWPTETSSPSSEKRETNTDDHSVSLPSPAPTTESLSLPKKEESSSASSTDGSTPVTKPPLSGSKTRSASKRNRY